MLGTLQTKKPQFYKQAALVRLVCGTQLPSTLTVLVLQLPCPLAANSMLLFYCCTFLKLKNSPVFKNSSITKDYTEASVQIPYSIALR